MRGNGLVINAMPWRHRVTGLNPDCGVGIAWKEAIIIDIPIPGKPRNLPTSYRLISFLSGSTLSLLLYFTYTNNIPRPQTGVQLALFADNIALYLRGSNFRQITSHLQKVIDVLTLWFQT
ncbi:hypothetical protein EVAR_81917_1 [Eumeta japonica]|uniref:Reverse transcriptase domain-containing protein n=1 Tax=Eumeta variegata TaxID=151549 RepID=A0A4C1UYD1_EUMVA|nr:hypothetical protein EVAR_81917_1 [Eumeta japonica]